MAFGIKIRQITTKNKYSIAELYEAIKSYPFTAGQPQLVKSGLMKVIAFPPLDRQNQVQIQAGMGKTHFTVTKEEQAGVGNWMLNSAISDVTHGISSLKGMVGSNAKRAEELVVITAQELQSLGL